MKRQESHPLNPFQNPSARSHIDQILDYLFTGPLTQHIEIKGEELIPPSGEPAVILFAPHTGWEEPFATGLASRRSGRKDLKIMTKIENLEDVPGIITGNRFFYVRRGEGDIQAIKETIHYLNQGMLVATALEGTRGETAGLEPAKGGLVYIANLAKAPIIPTVILGPEHLLPRPEEILENRGVKGLLFEYARMATRKRSKKPILHITFSTLYEEHLHDDRWQRGKRSETAQLHAHNIMEKYIIPHLPKTWDLGFYSTKEG